MKKTITRIVLIFTFSLLLSSCSFFSVYEKEPVGIGSDISELKRSPCACMLLKLPTQLPDWMTAQG